MTSRKFLLLIVLATSFATLILGVGASASLDQISVETATPVGIVSIQGGDNMGSVQLFPLSTIIDRTGIRAWVTSGWTGQGVRVGVLDQGFGGILDFEGRSGAIVTFPPGHDAISYSADAVHHGTQVMEVLHAIAGNAVLYACQYTVLEEYVSCIDWLISSGVRIINHSAGVPALPLDGTNEWAREVDRAARAGVLWINAAGNFASGYISDIFTDTNLNSYHEFRGSGILEALAVNPINSSQGRVLLSWDGTADHPANSINFDLEIVNAAGTVIADSQQPQTGNPGDRPIEAVWVQMNQPFGVRIRNVDARGDQVRFALFVEFASLPGNQQGAVIAPADSLSALTVGAMQGNVVAPYSSRGPLISGAIKPDVVAPGEILLADGQAFVGTSASAPIVAGLAALVWEANPTWSREQVYAYVRASTQDDSVIPGPDAVYGMGRLFVPAPLGIYVAPTATFTPSVMPTATPESVTLTPSPTESPTQTSPTPTETPTASATVPIKPTNAVVEPTLTTMPAQPVEGVSTEPSLPCVVIATVETVPIHVGPGQNRSVRGSLPINTEILVSGQAQAEDGAWWWMLNMSDVEAEANRYWVEQNVVSTRGDCSNVPIVDGSPVVQAPNSTPASGTGASSGPAGIDIQLAGYITYNSSENTTPRYTFTITEDTALAVVFTVRPAVFHGCDVDVRFWNILLARDEILSRVFIAFNNQTVEQRTITLPAGTYNVTVGPGTYGINCVGVPKEFTVSIRSTN